MKIWQIFLISLHFYISDGSANSLKLVQVLFRHGDRTPTETYPNDPHQNWIGGWGSLTNKGKLQLYYLGQRLREQYRNFLPEYYLTDNVYVRSSYADRCLMSAQTLLAGLFPPKGEQVWNPKLLWQPIPVRSVPRSEDNVIAMKKKCPVYEKALKAAYQTPKIKQIDEDNANLYDYLTTATGRPMRDINAVEYLYNTLEIEMQNNLTLPQWTKSISLDQLREIAKLNYAIFTDTTLMKRLTGGAFLTEIISHMKKKINQSSNLNIALYSGHDVTIVTVVRTLGFDKLFKPDYGSYIIFEMHETLPNEHEIKVFYGKNYETSPRQIELKFCQPPCSFQNFLNGLQPVLPSNWEAECLQL